ncbi:MAG: hypothetical protein ABIP51_05460 [Bacteroidia bacterium]
MVKIIKKKPSEKDKTTFPGYPLYPTSDDIYSKGKEEKDLNPEDVSKKKLPNEKQGTPNEKDFNDDMTGGDLDVPGSELDDAQENIGGDDHNNLDEDDNDFMD